MTAKQACELIVKHSDVMALNYAVNYAIQALRMDENSQEFKVQCLYIVNNIASWRTKKGHQITIQEIQDARQALKDV